MRERPAAGAAKDRALHDAVVRQRVVQDQVAGAEQVADDRLVGRVAADEHDRVFGADEVGDAAFQLAVQRLLAGDQPAGRDARAVAGHGVAGRLR